jgi:tetratricopeptide (TPR) repeat protein
VVNIGMPLGLSEVMRLMVETAISGQLGGEAFNRGDYVEAAHHYTKAIRVEKDQARLARLCLLLGRCELENNQYDRAEEALQQAGRIYSYVTCEDKKLFSLSDNWAIPSFTAWVHATWLPETEYENIEKAYNLVIKLNHPDYRYEAAVHLAVLEIDHNGRPENAKKLWEEAFVNAESIATRARSAYNLGRYMEYYERDRRSAARYYNEAKRLWPEGESRPDRIQ